MPSRFGRSVRPKNEKNLRIVLTSENHRTRMVPRLKLVVAFGTRQPTERVSSPEQEAKRSFHGTRTQADPGAVGESEHWPPLKSVPYRFVNGFPRERPDLRGRRPTMV